MYRNLSVYVTNGIAKWYNTLKNCLAVSRKIKCAPVTPSGSPIPRDLPRSNKNFYSHKGVHANRLFIIAKGILATGKCRNKYGTYLRDYSPAIKRNVPICATWMNLKTNERAPAGEAQWVEQSPANQKVSGLIPDQGTRLSCGPGPQ